MKKINNILRTFKGFKSKKLRTSKGFLQFQCSYKIKRVGSNRAICRKFLLTLSVLLLKITAERNCYCEKLKATVPSCSEGVMKSHSFSNISRDRKHRW